VAASSLSVLWQKIKAPKQQKGYARRAVAKKAPKVIENAKRALVSVCLVHCTESA
jgi:hypothetical protein